VQAEIYAPKQKSTRELQEQLSVCKLLPITISLSMYILFSFVIHFSRRAGFGIPTDYRTGSEATDTLAAQYAKCNTIAEAAVLNAMPVYVYVQLDSAKDDPNFKSCFTDMLGVACFSPEQQQTTISGFTRWQLPLLLNFSNSLHKMQVEFIS